MHDQATFVREVTKERNDARLLAGKSERRMRTLNGQCKRDNDSKKVAQEKYKVAEAKFAKLQIQEKRLKDELATRNAQFDKLKLKMAQGKGQGGGSTLCHTCGVCGRAMLRWFKSLVMDDFPGVS